MSMGEKLEIIAENVPKVFSAGKKAEQRAFWEVLTNNGAKKKYYYTFSENTWTKDNFKPTHTIAPTDADHMFYRHNYGNTAYNMFENLRQSGGTLDFSNCTNGNYAFESAAVSSLPTINNAKGTFTCFFRNCRFLTTITKIVCNDVGDQNFTQTFNYCNKLASVIFEGVIGRSISFPVSPLQKHSLKSIITALKDYTGGDEYSYSVGFLSSAFEELEKDGATAEYNGVACTWAELIDNKKWNLILT